MALTERIFIEGASGGREYDLSAIHAAEGRISLDGHIDMESAMRLMSLLKYMADEKKDVKLYINSTGGEIEAGLVMYDLIQSYPHKLEICCVGLAASMAALLLAGGRKGCRFILPHSKVLIHEPLIPGGFGGSATNIEKTAHRILNVKSQMNELLAKHTGKTVAEINEATAYDHLMTAEEAVAFGICDEIRSIF